MVWAETQTLKEVGQNAESLGLACVPYLPKVRIQGSWSGPNPKP